MKIQLWLSLFLLTVALAACGSKTQVKEAEKSQVTKEQEQEKLARKLVEEYVAFAGTQYELRITEQEAAKKGVDKENYDKICKMVEDTNKMLRDQIEEYRKDPKTKELILNGDTIVFDKKPNKE